MFNITTQYTKGYATFFYIQCPACGNNNTFHYAIERNFCRCWTASCPLHNPSRRTDVFARFGIVNEHSNIKGGKVFVNAYTPTKIILDKYKPIREEYERINEPITEDMSINAVTEYLKSRKVLDKVALFELGITKNKSGFIIPMFDKNQDLVFYQIRYLPDQAKRLGRKYHNATAEGVSKPVFNLYNPFADLPIKHIVEGAVCTLSMGANTVATLGSALEQASVELLHFAENNPYLTELNFIPDVGKKNFDGWAYAAELLKLNLPKRVKVSITKLDSLMKLDEKTNDPNAILTRVNNGKYLLRDLIKNRIKI